MINQKVLTLPAIVIMSIANKKACPAETAAGHACFITAQKRRPKQSGGFEQEPKLLYRNLDFLACNQMKSNSPGGNRKTA